jgi:glycosyltransferase involved in cell wall biosynthesis
MCSSAGGGDGAEFLRRNSGHYEALVGLLQSRSLRPEAWLSCARRVAEFAQFNHPGRFADGALENVALQLGEELRPCSKVNRQRPGAWRADHGSRGFRVLHVATVVCAVGGHTRTISNWARNDHTASHSLVVTAQASEPIPRWLVAALKQSGGSVIALPEGAPTLTRAAWLREVSEDGFDLVVLHHFGHDPVPTVAFARPGGPPVAVLNHADHLYWLGGGVSDLAVNLRRISGLLNERRFIRDEVIVPIPLSDASNGMSKSDARRALGIPEGQTVLLSVGRATKFKPTGRHDFFRSSAEALRRHPKAHLYVVGVGPSDLAAPLPSDVADRIHLPGEIQNPAAYQRAADVYLEPFPFGSQTSTLEAGFAGLAPVLAWQPPCPLLVTNDDALDGIAGNAASEDEYVEQISRLLRELALRSELGERFRRNVVSLHIGDQWLGRTRALYETAGRTSHRATRLPKTQCEQTQIDLGLSAWQATSSGNAGRGLTARRAVVAESAFAARESGDYRGAFNILGLGGSRWGVDTRLVAVAAKLFPHGFLSLLRERVDRVATC